MLAVAVAAGLGIAAGLLLPPSGPPGAPARVGPADNARLPADEAQGVAASINAADAHVTFGELAPNATATARGTLRNTGTQDLAIFDIHTTCSCLDVTLDSRMIPAGGELDFIATLEAPDRQDMPLRFQITFSLSNNVAPVTVQATGALRKLFEIEPRQSAGGITTGAIVRSTDGGAFTIEETPWFLRPVNDADGDDASSRAELDFAAAGRGVERFDATRTRLLLNHEAHGRIIIDWADPETIPARGLPPMQPRPESVVLTAAEAAAGHELEVDLVGPTADDLDRVTVETPGLQDARVEVLDRELTPQGIRYRLLLRIAEGERAWRGGVISFSYEGKPGATMQVIAGNER